MPFSIKGFYLIDKDIVLLLEVLFTHDSKKVEHLLCGAPSCSEPSLFFSNHFFGLWQYRAELMEFCMFRNAQGLHRQGWYKIVIPWFAGANPLRL